MAERIFEDLRILNSIGGPEYPYGELKPQKITLLHDQLQIMTSQLDDLWAQQARKKEKAGKTIGGTGNVTVFLAQEDD